MAGGDPRGGRNTFKGAGARPEANLSRNKGMVLMALSNKVTGKFKHFCKTELMDRFLHACIEYFSAFFDLQKHIETAEELSKSEGKLGREVESSQSQRLPAINTTGAVSATPPIATAVELEQAARARLREVAALYAAILVQHSNYANTQQDRQFFETLYDFSARVLFTINDRKRWHAIENELGRIFRSEHFNLSLRKNEQTASKPLRYKELFALKQDGDPSQRTVGAEAARHSSIHTAMHMRSPIIATIFPTPKERMQRAALLQHSIGFETQGSAGFSSSEGSPTGRGASRFGNSSGREGSAPFPRSAGGDDSTRASPGRLLTAEEEMDRTIGEAAQSFANMG